MWRSPRRLSQEAAPSWALTAGAWEKQMCAHQTSGRAGAHMELWMLTGTLVTKVTNCSCSLLGGSVPPETGSWISATETLVFRYLPPQDTVAPLPESLCLHQPAFMKRTWSIIIPGPLMNQDQQEQPLALPSCWCLPIRNHTKHKHGLQKWPSQ